MKKLQVPLCILLGAVIGAGGYFVADKLGGKPEAGPRKDDKQPTFAERRAQQEELLKKKLAENALWSDAKRKDELLGYLETARKLRLKALAPILVKHVAYCSSMGKDAGAFVRLSYEWPVYGALEEIGLPAVPSLLAEMKKTNPAPSASDFLLAQKKAGKLEDVSRKPNLLVISLTEVYDKGGHGRELALKRLELEITKTKDKKEKAILQAYLKHPAFKEPTRSAKEKPKKDSAAVKEKIRIVLAGMKQSDVAVYGRVRHVSDGVQESVGGADVMLVRSGNYKKKEAGGFIVPADGPAFLSFKADKNGLYFFDHDLVPGEYQLTASPPRDRNLAPVTQTLVVKAGDRLRRDILLPSGWVLTGRVMRADRKTPVVGASVMVRSLRPAREWHGRCKTDAKGNFRLGIGGALPCTLKAKDKSGNSAFIMRIDRDSALINGQTVKTATVILKGKVREGYALFCQLRAEGRVGLGKITCELRHKASGKLAGRATSNVGGGVEIEGLSPGAYLLYVTSPKTWQTKDGKPVAVEIRPTQKARMKVIIVPLIKSGV